MLNAAQDDEFGAPCNPGENIFLFLTDGEPTAGVTDTAGLQSILNEYNKDISLFTYALGEGADTTILSSLSCSFNGMMFQISESSTDSTLATVMRNYYTYVAEGVTTTSPVWTEPYDDAFGLGRMVTVSMPVYYQEGSIRTILGVVGLDVSMTKLQ